MNPTISYKAMDTNKSYRAVFYDATLWISDFDFFKTELLFLASLLKSNSFKSNFNIASIVLLSVLTLH